MNIRFQKNNNYLLMNALRINWLGKVNQ